MGDGKNFNQLRIKYMSQKGFANIILIGVVVIIVGTLGYFMLRRQTGFPQSAQQPQIISRDIAEPVDVIHDMENWVACRNARYGYDVKYPTDWKVWDEYATEQRPGTCIENIRTAIFSPRFQDFRQPDPESERRGQRKWMLIDVYDQERILSSIGTGVHSLDEYFQKISKIGTMWAIDQPVQWTMLDGKRAAWTKSGHKLLTFHNDLLYEFRRYEVDDATFNQFLGSFKFIQPISACVLKPQAGTCKALYPRSYFNQETGKCTEFNWGGCGGVVPFETLEGCRAVCEQTSKPI